MKKYLSYIILLLSFALCLGAYEGGVVHEVKQGDTLGKIVRQYFPLTAAYTKTELLQTIKKINNIDAELSLGQNILIPVTWEKPLVPHIIAKPATFEAKGFYMNRFSAGTRYILNTAYKLKEAGGNTIVFDAKDDYGILSYESPIPKRYAPGKRYTANIEDFPKMIDFLHRMGIHVVARVVVFRDPFMSRVNPQWCYNLEKKWLDPDNPEVQAYILAIIRELCSSGVDEIQLDYIRYFADGKTTTSKGISRTDVIATFVRKVHDVTSAKNVLLSMDMFGIVVWQRDVDILSVGQDVMKLKDCVDIISPMIYPSHFGRGFSGVKNPANEPYKFVTEGVRRMKKLVGDEVVIRPWLQAFPLHVTQGWGAQYIKQQIDASNNAGAIGWLLWSPGNKYKDSYAALEELKKQKDKDQAAGLPFVMLEQMPVQPQEAPAAVDELTPPLKELAETATTSGIPVLEKPFGLKLFPIADQLILPIPTTIAPMVEEPESYDENYNRIENNQAP